MEVKNHPESEKVTAIPLTILYRGPLSSCNYACGYCPFAKHTETLSGLRADRQALARFVDWAVRWSARPLRVFFTPWGEAVVRPWYRVAIATLSQQDHVEKVAIQTNLSVNAKWTESCNNQRLGIWATYHPGEVSRTLFLRRCLDYWHRGVPISVGVVGLHQHIAEIEALRQELPADIYLWVNAYKRQPGYYDGEQAASLEVVDPFFPINNQYHSSYGRSCRTGNSVIAVDGEGMIRRCHFVAETLGNLYSPDFEHCLRERLCPNTTCGCHIGYVHLDHLQQQNIYGAGILERIPHDWPEFGFSMPRAEVNSQNASAQV